jgi:tetraacyldisaccharide 4'-kinase
MGRLREWSSAYKRADILIVTKCPDQLTNEEKNKFLLSLKPLKNQQVFFSRYIYSKPYHFFDSATIDLTSIESVILLTGIANADYLSDHLSQYNIDVHNVAYGDHHYFSPHEVSLLKLQLDNLSSSKKIILTTEKDATRLFVHREYLLEHKLPIFILPIQVGFLFDEQSRFDQEIQSFLLNFTV